MLNFIFIYVLVDMFIQSKCKSKTYGFDLYRLTVFGVLVIWHYPNQVRRSRS